MTLRRSAQLVLVTPERVLERGEIDVECVRYGVENHGGAILGGVGGQVSMEWFESVGNERGQMCGRLVGAYAQMHEHALPGGLAEARDRAERIEMFLRVLLEIGRTAQPRRDQRLRCHSGCRRLGSAVSWNELTVGQDLHELIRIRSQFCKGCQVVESVIAAV